MSLMQLLAVGRSIRTVRNERSPYRMAQQNLLPKFIPGKGDKPPENTPAPVAPLPVAPLPVAAPPVVAPPVVAPPVVAPPVVAPSVPVRDFPDEPAFASERPQTMAPEPARKREHPAAAALASVIGFVRRWSLLKKNPFAPAPVRPLEKPAVQCELSLETVRPVRNDLSDADLEVVPAGPLGEAASRAEDREQSRFLWSRLTARLFGARFT